MRELVRAVLIRYNGHTMKRRLAWLMRGWAVALLAATTAACAPSLPREWREAIGGPDATATPRLHLTLTPEPTFSMMGTPTPLAPPTPLPTLTTVPTRTATPTNTATPTPATASLTLQQGATWYVGGRMAPYTGVEDTHISAWNRNANYAAAQALSIRSGDIMEALIYFHLADLPDQVTIMHAEIALYVSGRSNDTPMTVAVRPVLKPWLLNEATWLAAQRDLSWQIPGAMGDSDRAEEPVANLEVTGSGAWLSFDATPLVQQWLRSPQTNQGIILTGNAANAVQYDLASADAQDSRRRPRLTLTFATGAIALGPARTASATPTIVPTADPSRPDSINVLPFLPQSSAIVARTSGDVDGDGVAEIIAAYRGQRETGVHLAVLQRSAANGPVAYRLYWNSPSLAVQTPITIELRDVTQDGRPDMLVSGASPASGRSLYVVVRRPGDFRLVRPVGGYFGDKDYFGESGYDLVDAGGRTSIATRHGDIVDTYTWDGANFTVQGR